jgi:hypothetical protein
MHSAEDNESITSRISQLSLSASQNELVSFLAQFRDNWYCYWDGSYGPPADTSANYVFKPALLQTQNGLVISEAMDFTQVRIDTVSIYMFFKLLFSLPEVN